MFARILICLAVTGMASAAAAESLPQVVQPQASISGQAPTTCRTAPGGDTGATCTIVLPASALESGSLVLHVSLAASPPGCKGAQVLELGAPERGAIPIVHGAGGDGRKSACQSAARAASSANAAP